ncbi:MAG: M48 family metallopeptidase [Sterolibacteriaceae bacterium MAG5]|nr:M48 family metallopeptidase [Candidatus Nitricoxidireducens bremensis]
MAATIDLGDLHIEVVRKDIKNLHLSVLPPSGLVRIAAPGHMSQAAIRAFAISKLTWIRSQRRRMQMQEREAPREYLDRESHYVWGKRVLLRLVEKDAAPVVDHRQGKLLLQVRPGTDAGRCREVLDGWYRAQLRAALPDMVAKWERAAGVRVGRIFVQRMKTRWGSCNPDSGAIRLNTDLAKKPPECLEYILVHEIAHLIERSHNARFTSLMDVLLPQWLQLRRQLNQLPVRHEDWDY